MGNLWWNDPRKAIDVESVTTALKQKFETKYGHFVEKELIQELLEDLQAQGLINKTLFHPRRTKVEYFWLFCIQILINVLAIIPEIVNNGFKTERGAYYSWDIRLYSFLTSILFLMFYYKRYHVQKNLNQRISFFGCSKNFCPILCGCKKDKPMQAIPDDSELEGSTRSPTPHLKLENRYSREIQTQTSNDPTIIKVETEDKSSNTRDEKTKK